MYCSRRTTLANPPENRKKILQKASRILGNPQQYSRIPQKINRNPQESLKILVNLHESTGKS